MAAEKGCVEHHSLQFNCGFARVAVFKLTRQHTVKFKSINKHGSRAELSRKFQSLYDSCPKFGLCEDYFSETSKHPSRFNKACDRVTSAFHKKWYPYEKRQEYINTFSISQWEKLSSAQKRTHTLRSCDACYNEFKLLQQIFPEKPVYTPTQVLQVNLTAAEGTKKKDPTKQGL